MQEGAPSVTERKIRILVIEDEASVQDMVKKLLEMAGWEVLQAYHVAEAVQILRDVRPLPDVTILDLMLPDIDGFELLRQMRSKKVFDALPVVILSALADHDSIRKGLSLGADRYVTKPGITHNLVKIVKEVLKTGRRKEMP